MLGSFGLGTQIGKRRRHPRVRVPAGQIIPVDLNDDRQGSRTLGLVENLSLGGICVRISRHGLRPHTTVPLQFVLPPQDHPIHIAGKSAGSTQFMPASLSDSFPMKP